MFLMNDDSHKILPGRLWKEKYFLESLYLFEPSCIMFSKKTGKPLFLLNLKLDFTTMTSLKETPHQISKTKHDQNVSIFKEETPLLNFIRHHSSFIIFYFLF
jgi:hypothetical protein